MKKTVLMALPLFLSLVTGAAAKKAVQVYAGPWGEVVETDLAVHPMKDESYTESWFLMVQGEGDLLLFVHFGISNLQPLSDFDGAIETTVLHNGKTTFVKDNFKKSRVKYKDGKLDLAIGKNTIKQVDGAIQMYVTQSGVELQLTATPQVGGIKPSPTVFPDKRTYELHVAAPRATIQGTLKLDGKTVPVKGVGYLDHSVQNYPAHKMADRLYSFRGFSETDGVNLLSFTLPKDLGGVEMPALVLLKDNEVVARSTSVKMTGESTERDSDNKYTYPTVWTLEATDGEKAIKGTIKLDKRVQRQNAADDFNFFERTLIKTFVANPMLYRHLGDFAFEITGGEQPVTVGGQGVAEVLILRE